MAFGDLPSACSTPQHLSDSDNDFYSKEKRMAQLARKETIIPGKDHDNGEDVKVNEETRAEVNDHLIDIRFEHQSDHESGASRRRSISRSTSSQVPGSTTAKRATRRKVMPGIGWYHDDWYKFKDRMNLEEVYTIAVLNGEPAHIKRYENEKRKESAELVKSRRKRADDPVSSTSHRHYFTACNLEDGDISKVRMGAYPAWQVFFDATKQD
jgi:hypothetical protein